MHDYTDVYDGLYPQGPAGDKRPPSELPAERDDYSYGLRPQLCESFNCDLNEIMKYPLANPWWQSGPSNYNKYDIDNYILQSELRS